MSALSPGATLQNGKYRIESVLGQGGFGITYLATQPLMLDRKVCIKEFFLKDYFSRDSTTSHVTCATESTREMAATYRRKFIKEAQFQLQMHHKGLVEVYDIFEENDTAYYAMEYVEGESLLDIVKRRGALPEAEAVGYIRQVADALDFIHSHQIAHLDVKPGNILIDKNGVVKLIDFGTSKHYDAKTGTQTTIATPCYSPGYAPIEQYKIGGQSTFTPESDVYSLGATFYKLVTGQTPPEPSELLSTPLDWPINVSHILRRVVEAAMEVQISQRTKCVKEFVAALIFDDETKVLAEDEAKEDSERLYMPELDRENFLPINSVRLKSRCCQRFFILVYTFLCSISFCIFIKMFLSGDEESFLAATFGAISGGSFGGALEALCCMFPNTLLVKLMRRIDYIENSYKENNVRYARFIRKGKVGIYNLQKNRIWKFAEYDNIVVLNGDTVVLQKDCKYGLLSKDSSVELPAIYDTVSKHDNGLLFIKSNGEKVLVNI